MTNSKISMTIIAIVIGAIMTSCSDSNSSNIADEFIAGNSDFANWTSWTKVDEKQGPDPALGEAHSGNDSTVKRIIYIKDNAQRGSSGQFPVGTRVVKETRDKDGNLMMITAMAKRGGTFNQSHNGWEWFVLEDNAIKDRGADLMGGMCSGCHSAVKSTKDYVFSK